MCFILSEIAGVKNWIFSVCKLYSTVNNLCADDFTNSKKSPPLLTAAKAVALLTAGTSFFFVFEDNLSEKHKRTHREILKKRSGRSASARLYVVLVYMAAVVFGSLYKTGVANSQSL